MSDLANKIAGLSPEKRALLVRKLKAQQAAANVFPLSFAQERLWLLDRMSPGNPFYNITTALEIRGAPDLAALRTTLDEIDRRHESLRTAFLEIDGEPMQRITRPAGAPFGVIDLTALDPGRRETVARNRARIEARRPFDLQRNRLWRTQLLRLEAKHHVLLLSMHHVISDGWSMGVLVGEVSALYQAFCNHRPSPLPPLPIQYPDFATWQRQRLGDGRLEEQLDYWKERLAELPVLTLPTDRPRPPKPSWQGRRRPFFFDAAATQAVRSFSQEHGLTLFMTLLAAFDILLARVAGQWEVVVGTPIAQRNRREVEPLIGFFVNSLVLRTRVDPALGFAAATERARETSLSAFAHQDLPFEKLVHELRTERDPSRNPLFQVMFAVQNAPGGELELPGLEVAPFAGGIETCRFDLHLDVWERGDTLRCVFEHAVDLFEDTTVERLARRFLSLVPELLTNPERPLAELPLLDRNERHQLLREWNDTARPYPRGDSLATLFETVAARRGGATAVRGGGRMLRYTELDRRANQLANHLQRLGVAREAVVGICVERTPELVVALLGVLKASGAYLPLDPAYPRERLAYMLEDAGARLLITQEHLASLLPETDLRIVRLDTDDDEIARQPTEPPARGDHPSELAYLMYTSGSTGRPKGVAVPQRAVVRLVWDAGYVRLGEEDVFLHFAPFSFDASTFEIWGALLTGAELVVVPPGRISAGELVAAVERHGVTVLWLTSALFQQVVDDHLPALRGVRQLLAGGDVLPPDRVHRVLTELPETVLINGYGPTENTTFTTCHRMEQPRDASSRVPLGRPVARTCVHLADTALRPVPTGTAGELLTGGDGLARSYYASPELTAERFVPDPFSGIPGARLYRTGDRVRWCADGTLDFLGRLDHQLKVRGYRVEPGEVERVLLAHPAVSEAVAGLRGDGASARLVSWLVAAAAEPSQDVLLTELRSYLQRRLPEPMVPSHLVLLDVLPMTPSGKVDRRALPDPEPDRSALGSYTAPATPEEEQTAAIWAELLGHEQIGVHDNFFSLGGHSLLATQVISRMRDAFNVDLPLETLFAEPTVSALARRVAAARGRTAPEGGEDHALRPITPAPPGTEIPLSYGQERLWFLHRLTPESRAYHEPAAFALSGPLDLAALRRALGEIVRRHQVLRTAFPEVEGRPIQRVADRWDVPLPLVDLAALPARRRLGALNQVASRLFRPPFDLDLGPLFRLAVVRLEEGEHQLHMTMHHIVFDGWSIGVLTRELLTLYERFSADPGAPSPLPELPVQYGDFARHQRRWLAGSELERQLAWWRRQLAGAPVLELPTDRPRRPVERGTRLQIRLPEHLAERLRALGQAQGATLFMTLLAGFQWLLQQVSGQDDVVVGSPIAGRNRAEIEDLIGFFVNMLPLRTRVDPRGSFRALLEAVRELTLEAYTHQELPFEKLVEELRLERDLTRHPVFQVAFQLFSVPRSEPGGEASSLRMGSGTTVAETAKFDLNLSLTDHGDRVAGWLEYSTDLFDETTVRRWMQLFRHFLERVAEHPEHPLEALATPTPVEHHQLLVEWNDVTGPLSGSPARSLPALVAEQAGRTPRATALVAGDVELDYRSLLTRARRLARYLRDRGAGLEERVAVCLRRTPDLPVALLAVLECGGAYVPVDPAYPPARRRYMIEDSGAQLLITDSDLAAEVETDGVPVVLVDDEAEAIARCSAEPMVVAGNSRLAYVIYTSGSTGRPKGVAIEHRSVAALVAWARGFFPADGWRAVLATTSVCFDLSVFELFVTWGCGGKVELVDDALALLDGGIRAGAAPTLVNTVPSALEQVMRAGALPESVRYVNLAGETPPAELLRSLGSAASVAAVWNLYGPSEDTTYSTVARVLDSGNPSNHIDDDRAPVPIGRPIQGSWVRLLGRRGRLVPAGAVGEIAIGGSGLARGYLGRPAATAERFVPDPYTARSSGTGHSSTASVFEHSAVGARPGARLYLTGDLARHLADGQLVFLGRRDQQIKLRGYRIELGEIESVLAEHPEVQEAIVLHRQGAAGPRLVACVNPVDTTISTKATADTVPSTTENKVPGTTESKVPGPKPQPDSGLVNRLLGSLPNRPRVVELGGDGTLLTELAPHADQYLTLEPNDDVLDKLRQRASNFGIDDDRLELRAGGVEEIAKAAAGRQLVILHAHRRLFPDPESLGAAIDVAAQTVERGGTVVVDGVLSAELAELFSAARELEEAPSDMLLDELRRRIDGAEPEPLAVTPSFFAERVEGLDALGWYAASPREGRGDADRLLYTAILSTAEEPAETVEPTFVDWLGDGLSLGSLAERLKAEAPPVLGVVGAPDSQLLRLRRLRDFLDGDGESDRGLKEVGDLIAALDDGADDGDHDDEGSVELTELRRLADDHGYLLEASWAWQGDADEAVHFDFVLARVGEATGVVELPAESEARLLWPLPATVAEEGPTQADSTATDQMPASTPSAEEQRLGAVLRDFLGRRLPSPLVPAAYAILRELPRLPNGKIDRGALEKLADPAAAVGRRFVAPRTDAEERVAAIWRELLDVERVGVEDNFFTLGGHSLLATQAVARLRDEFGLEVPIKWMFEHPTVAALTRRLEAARGDLAADAVPLERAPRGIALPLSFSQERLWFLHQLLPDNRAYLESAAFTLGGELDRGALARGLTEIVRRHEVLRTAFPEEDGSPTQRVAPPTPVELPMVDLRALPPSARRAALRRTAAALHRPFDLACGPLCRFALVRLEDAQHQLLMVIHHIVFDGWSVGVMTRELMACYAVWAADPTAPAPRSLAPLAVQYGDFAYDQRRRLRGERLEAEVEHWQMRLAGAPPLELPTDRPRRTIERGARLPFFVEPPLASELRRLGSSRDATPFMTLLAAVQLWFGRLAAQDDVVVGSPIAGRERPELEPLIGFFVNMLVLRADLGGGPTIHQLLDQVRATTLDAYAHQEVPFARLVEELQPERDLARHPIFQVAFQLFTARRGPSAGDAEGRVTLGPGVTVAETAKFDLNLSLTDDGEQLSGWLEYSVDLFDDTTVARWLHGLRALLEGVVHSPETPVAELPLLAAAERHQLLREWNDAPAQPAPEAPDLASLFASRMAAIPDAPALTFDAGQDGAGHLEWSYGELYAKAKTMAEALRRRGVGPGRRVALFFEPEPALIAALLGVLEAGAAYVPLDTESPPERLALILDDTDPAVVLTGERVEDRLPEAWRSDPRRLTVGAGGEVAEDFTEALTTLSYPRRPSPEAVAYVIYTSGSTGKPKGVEVSHGNVLRLFCATEPEVGFGADDVWTLFHSAAFDFSVWEIWGALAHGGRLVIVPHWSRRSPAELWRLLHHEKVTVLNQTPSAFRQLLQAAEEPAPPTLRCVIFGGEALDLATLAPWYRRFGDGVRLVNMYGITETTVHVTWRPLLAREAVPGPSAIGRPLRHLRVHLLDRRLSPVPIGVAGELYVGGGAVSRGYLGRPGLTAERFVPDLFGEELGARLYRSGDLARRLADGELEYLGRGDLQIKLRGFRIEPGEIEAALRDHSEVDEAVVILRKDGAGSHRLVAYTSPRQTGAEPPAKELASFLRRRLPPYMVPTHLVLVDAIPLTANGKLDRRALRRLPIPGLDDGADDEARYRTATEELVAEVFREILGRRQVGRNDDFFALGGHSLLATRAVSRLGRDFGIELPVRRIFERPTVAELATEVDRALAGGLMAELPPLEPASRNRPLPLSFAQERLWFLDRLEPGAAVYNIPALLHLPAGLDAAALERSLTALEARHESLRTTFRAVDGEPFQVIGPPRRQVLQRVDLSGLPKDAADAAARRWIASDGARNFDLERGPLWRALLIQLSGGHRLLLTLHHTITDGGSMDILLQELELLYHSELQGEPATLPALPVQYADFAVWQRSWLQGQLLERQLDHWRRSLDGAPTVLELPTDRRRAAQMSYRGARRSIDLGSGVGDRLRRVARGEGATFFMALLASFGAVLSRHAGQDDLVIGSPVANRRHPDLEGIVGLFVNTLALRVRTAGDPTFRELLNLVRHTTLDAYGHQDLPFERLVNELGIERSLDRSPLFQVMLVLRNSPKAAKSEPRKTDADAIGTTPFTPANPVSAFDLTLSVTEGAGELTLDAEHSTALFDGTTVERLLCFLRRFIERVADDSGARLSEIPSLVPTEAHQLLWEWNDAGQSDDLDGGNTDPWCRFVEWARRNPGAPALVEPEGDRLTYGELASRAWRMAGRLQQQGIGPEVRVALLLDRSIDLVTATLAVLGAGGTFVPIDPTYPPARQRFLLDDANVALLVSHRGFARELDNGNGDRTSRELLDLDRERIWLEAPEKDDTFESVAAPPETGAYVIYTSGSTGRPKGVTVSRRSLGRYAAAAARLYRLGVGDRVLQLSSPSFDIAVDEIFPTLTHGATVSLRRRGMESSATELFAGCAEEGITVLMPPTALWHELAEAAAQAPERVPRSLRLVCFGGERVLAGPTAAWRRTVGDRVRLLNCYGPTESTVGITFHPLAGEPDSEIPIGRPLPGREVAILDLSGNPTPWGVPGELCAAGDGLARGYLGRPAATAKVFVPHPAPRRPGERLYRTGDRAHWRRDGRLEFLGRLDRQLKVRGMRVEPGEVESALAELPGVQEAAVAALDGSTGLTAWVVAAEGVEADAESLDGWLRERLPAALVPTHWQLRDELPRTPNGKIDRDALIKEAVQEASRQSAPAAEAPRDELESELLEIFRDVLGRPNAGIRDDFFTLGGHSLLTVRLIARIEHRLGHRLPVAAVFEGGTVERLARILRRDESRYETGLPEALVAIQPHGSRPPIYCVHPAGGDVLCYRELSRALGPEQPLYGLASPELDPASPAPTMEELADGHIATLRAAGKEGPWLLCGWSTGGWLALEMARQLRREGDTLALLALFDSHPPPVPDTLQASTLQNDRAKRLAEFVADLNGGRPLVDPAELRELSDVEQDATIRERCASLGVLPEAGELEHLAERFEMYRRHVDAFESYRPTPFDGPVGLLASTIDPTAPAWADLNMSSWEISELPGDHFSILRDPGVNALAREIRRRVDRAVKHHRLHQLLILSAADRDELEQSTEELAKRLAAAEENPPALANLAHTLHANDRSETERRMLVASDPADARDALESRDTRRIVTGTVSAPSPKVVLLIPGLGDHHPGMTRELYRVEPIFRRQVDRCAEILRPLLGEDLRTALYGGASNGDESETKTLNGFGQLVGRLPRGDADAALHSTRLAQPASFTVTWALAQLWSSWGIRPDALIGYSLGEYVAACLAGVLGLEDALRLVTRRAELIEALPTGGMLAVLDSEARVLELLGSGSGLALAAINGPELCVVSGPNAALEGLAHHLDDVGVLNRRLPTRHAFHSPAMDPVGGALAELCTAVPLAAPKVPYLSNVTGGWITAAEATDPDYWVRHLCSTVQLHRGLTRLLRDRPSTALLEVGSGQLGALAWNHPDATRAHNPIACLPGAQDTRSETEVLVEAAGRLWITGVEIHRGSFYEGQVRRPAD